MVGVWMLWVGGYRYGYGCGCGCGTVGVGVGLGKGVVVKVVVWVWGSVRVGYFENIKQNLTVLLEDRDWWIGRNPTPSVHLHAFPLPPQLFHEIFALVPLSPAKPRSKSALHLAPPLAHRNVLSKRAQARSGFLQYHRRGGHRRHRRRGGHHP